MKYVINS